MHQEGIMETMDFDQRLLATHAEPIDKARSSVVLLDNHMVGALVIVPLVDGKGYLVTGRWVAPGLRHGWVNALLMANSIQKVLDRDLDYIRFVANSSYHTETVRLAERMGGHRVKTRYRWAKPCTQNSSDP